MVPKSFISKDYLSRSIVELVSLGVPKMFKSLTYIATMTISSLSCFINKHGEMSLWVKPKTIISSVKH